MSKHLVRDLATLDRDLLALSSVVEEMIDEATRALIRRDLRAAVELVDVDRDVDRREVYIEESCLKILALHQPVAVDLRRVATVLKINNDLERIGDLAVNVAERAAQLAEFPEMDTPAKLEQMAAESRSMVNRALDAYVHQDVAAARIVCQSDDDVDSLNAQLITELKIRMAEEPQWIEPALHFFSASRHFERIADHATNIAEDVIYLADGEIVRHRHDDIPHAGQPAP